MQVTVPCYAKLNLDLRVLGKRPDGYHELRTIFQTISLHDSLAIEFVPRTRTRIELRSLIQISDNLVARAAEAVVNSLKLKGLIRLELRKQIPIGAGLGGGSSDAAAVLLALPALAGKRIPLAERVRLAESLGSDVPFFLLGGTAIGVGRGTELYPIPDPPTQHALIVSSGIHISTPDAYRLLNRPVAPALTSLRDSPILGEFQTIVWALADRSLDQLPLKNDFEEAVFGTHQELASLLRKLRRLGARPARMTGSGSAVFGIFHTAAEARAAAARFPSGMAFPVRFLSRGQYRNAWRAALGTAANAGGFAP